METPVARANKPPIHYWGLSIICYVQLFYTATLFYSPVYFILLALAPIMLLSVFHSVASKQSKVVLGGVLVLVYVTINQFAMSVNYSAYANFSLGFLSFLYIVSMKNRFSREMWVAWAVRAVKFGGGILLVDTLWRLTHPQHPAMAFMTPDKIEMIGFYLYKFGGIMFEDSNTTAIASIVLFFLGFYLKEFHKCRLDGWLILHLLIIISCLSRSAYISFVLTYLFLTRRKWFWATLGLAGAVALAVGFQSLVDADGSFTSKFFILGLAFDFARSMGAKMLLFGLGLDNSVATFGMYTHILYLTYAIELGLAGLVLMLGYWWFVMKASRKQMKYLFVPIGICSLSYFFYIGAPFVLVPMGYLLVLSGMEDKVPEVAG